MSVRIVEINAGNIGSTGTIMLGIADIAKTDGHEVLVCCPDARENRKKTVKYQLFIGDRFSRNLHLKSAELTGLNGCFSRLATKKFLNTIGEYKPDMIHFHNLHGSYINLPLLFRFVKKHNIPVVWTLHDCWSFTGHCPYFDMVGCDKWKTGCHHCSQYREYPRSLVDNSRYMYKLKKKWFTGVKNMTLVTPSGWLAELAKQSFLRDYPVKVINNGIDLSIFKPTSSDFRQKYNIGEKYIVLGVAFGWGKRKGLDVFIELAKRLDKEKYQIVLVGTDECSDKLLPDSVISIHRTQNQTELAAIYTAADVFANPTREEAFGLVNIEALACGTPGVTFNTGGSPECFDKTCGSVVDKDDIDALETEILRICETKPYSKDDCIYRASHFNKKDKFKEYIELYEVVNGEK